MALYICKSMVCWREIFEDELCPATKSKLSFDQSSSALNKMMTVHLIFKGLVCVVFGPQCAFLLVSLFITKLAAWQHQLPVGCIQCNVNAVNLLGINTFLVVVVWFFLIISSCIFLCLPVINVRSGFCLSSWILFFSFLVLLMKQH